MGWPVDTRKCLCRSDQAHKCCSFKLNCLLQQIFKPNNYLVVNRPLALIHAADSNNCSFPLKKESDLKKFYIFRDMRDEIDSGYKYKDHSFRINLA